MAQYINKAALVAEIKTRIETYNKGYANGDDCRADALETFLHDIDFFEAKEVDEQKERMNECPFRQVGCAMYEGHILECKEACSWVVDYPKLKKLKAQKGE